MSLRGLFLGGSTTLWEEYKGKLAWQKHQELALASGAE